MLELQTWINNPEREYADGVRIYKQLGTDSKKKTFYETEKPTTLHRNMLFADLARMYRIADANKKIPATKGKAITPTPIDLSKLLKNVAPEKLKQFVNAALKKEYETLSAAERQLFANDADFGTRQEAYNQAVEMRKEMTALHEKIKLPELSEEERAETSKLLLDLEQEEQKRWLIVDGEESGFVPEDDNEDEEGEKATNAPQTTVELMKRRTNIVTYISKVRKKLETVTDTKAIQKLNEQLSDYNKELEEITAKLNAV